VNKRVYLCMSVMPQTYHFHVFSVSITVVVFVKIGHRDVKVFPAASLPLVEFSAPVLKAGR
jgi:hypothetical protein